MEQLSQKIAKAKQNLLSAYFHKLNDMQKRAVFQINGPLLILAGAGSGKTTVLINRIENMVRFGDAYHDSSIPPAPSQELLDELKQLVEHTPPPPEQIARALGVRPILPWQILAITFTNKAAGELKNRLADKLGELAPDIHASTFHSLCVRILRREIGALGYGTNFTIYDTDDSLRIIKQGLHANQIDEKILPARGVLSAISRSKDSLLSSAEMLRQSQNDYRLTCIAKIYDYYQQALKEANALDFDDLIVLTVRLFSQCPEVLEKYQNRWRYIMVDEYQDTNQTQYRLVSLLAAKCQNLCVVGDDDQSIYKFRGATIENILSFEEQFKNAAAIRLEQNYRSTQNILSAANAVIANNSARKGKNLWTDAGDGDKIKLLRLRDELAEARHVAETILHGVEQGGKWSDYAVLYRMNAQSNAIEKALAQRTIPYRIVGGVRFYERKEIKDVVAYLSVINNTQDTLRLLRIINEPKRGIGSATLSLAQQIADTLGESLFSVIARADEYAPLERKAKPLIEFAGMLNELTKLAETAPLSELLDELLERTDYLRSLEAQGAEGLVRIENVMELKSNILNYAQQAEEPSLGGFLEEIALYTDLDNYDNSADTVVLMTVHSAKGLEFRNVFLVGMEEGVFPGRNAINMPEELEEERRLAYVAITRAKESLSISNVERRMLFGQASWGRLSRFAQEIPEKFLERDDRTAVQRKPAAAAPVFSGNASARSIGVGEYPAAQAAQVVSVAPGDKVRHRVFGEGQVLRAQSMGGDTLLEIEFDTAGKKKVMSNFAKLEKL